MCWLQQSHKEEERKVVDKLLLLAVLSPPVRSTHRYNHGTYHFEMNLVVKSGRPRPSCMDSKISNAYALSVQNSTMYV